MIGLGLGLPQVAVRRGGFDPDAAALWARRSTPPTVARMAIDDTLVKALKAAGVWPKLDVLYVLAAADSQAARLNWKSSSFTATPVNSPTFTADRGYQGDGVSSYLDSGFNPTTAGGLFSQDSGHISIWSRSSEQTTVADAGNSNSLINARESTDQTPLRINAAATIRTPLASVTDGKGHFVASRTSSSSSRAYRNGSPLTAEQASVSSSVDSNSIRFCGRSATVQYSTRQLALGSIGAGLSAADVAAMFTAVQAYMQAAGAL